MGRRNRIEGMSYILEEDLQDTTSFFVDETRDTLDTATTSKTTDGLS